MDERLKEGDNKAKEERGGHTTERGREIFLALKFFFLSFFPNLSVENSVVRKMTRTSTKKNPAVISVHIFPSYILLFFCVPGEDFHFFFLW